MRILFAGTPEAAVPSLEVLAASGHDIVRVVTRPPAPLGRKRVLTPSPVDTRARELGLAVLPAATLGDREADELAGEAAELGVIVAYGGLVKEPLLSAPRLGWINLHFSMLPRWRGAAPVQRAIIAGDRVTGAQVFQLEAGLDTGPVFAGEQVAIGALETAGHLLERLAPIGARVLAGVVDQLAAGTATAVPQEGEPVPAPKLTLDDGRLDWTESAATVFDRIRGCTPEPGAWAEHAGRRFKIHEAAPARDAPQLGPGRVATVTGRVLIACGAGALELLRVQPEGKAAMPAADWLRGTAGDVVLS